MMVISPKQISKVAFRLSNEIHRVYICTIPGRVRNGQVNASPLERFERVTADKTELRVTRAWNHMRQL